VRSVNEIELRFNDVWYGDLPAIRLDPDQAYALAHMLSNHADKAEE
jgi:hypothetical protein